MNPLSIALYGYSIYNFLKKDTTTTEYSEKIKEIQENESIFNSYIKYATTRLKTAKNVTYNKEYDESIEAVLTVSVTAIGGNLWNSKFNLTLKNTTTGNIRIWGIFASWGLQNYTSLFYPCTLEQFLLKPDEIKNLRLDGTFSRYLFQTGATKTIRDYLKYIGKHKQITGSGYICIILDLGNGEFAVRYIYKPEVFISWDGATAYKDCGQKHEETIKLLKEMARQGQNGLPFIYEEKKTDEELAKEFNNDQSK